MKKRLLTLQFFAVLVLLIIIAVAPASSWGLSTGDAAWQWVNPSVQGNTLRSLSFVNANTGWAVGDGGTVLKTADGGVSWSAQTPAMDSCAGVVDYGNGCNLRGVSFVDANNGWVVGAYGTIWHTINGGSSWTAQALPAPQNYANLYGVHFINSSVGIAVGPSYAFATRDGGTTWVKVNGIDTGKSLNAVQLLDSSNAVAVGDNGAVYKINWSSGTTWNATLQTTPGTQSLTGLYFYNGSYGFAVGGGHIWKTDNGGNSWTQNTTPRAENMRAITVTGGTMIITGGTEVFGESSGSSVILRRYSPTIWTDTVDNVATNLTAASTGTTDQLLAVTFPGGSSTGFAAGEAGGIVKTTDTGSNWTLKAGGNGKRYSDSSFINDTTGWMVAMDGSVAKTANAGGNWISDSSGIPAGTKLRGVSFLDASTGFAVGYSGLLGNGTNTGVAYKYISGTWSAMSVPSGVATLEAVHMTSATDGWAVGRAPGDTGAGAGVALKTTDGSNWVFDRNGIDGNIRLYGVDSTNSINGWAVGENITTGKAVILKYTPGTPGSWTVTEETNTQGFLSIDIVEGGTGYAVGYVSPSTTNTAYNQEGRIYKTTDAGANWTDISPADINAQFRFLVGVSFLDASTGFIVASEGGRILKTTNGGTDWTVEPAGVGTNLSAVSVVPSTWSTSGYVVFAAGDNASILRAPTPDETKINARWTALGGAPGTPIGNVTPTSGGLYKDYTNGRLYWNQSTDQVYWVHGAIISKYDAMGREFGVLGLPLSDEYAVTGGGGVAQNFAGYSNIDSSDNGRMYWSAATGPREIHGEILTKFDAIGGRATFGFPTTDVFDIPGKPGALEADFQGTRIYTSAATGTHEVHGAILSKFLGAGGIAWFGLPTSDELVVPNVAAARYSQFQYANVYWSSWTWSHVVYGEILTRYLTLNAATYGLPVTDTFVMPGNPNALECDLTGARIYWSADTGAHEVHGAILSKWLNAGGAAWFGLPKSDEYDVAGVSTARMTEFKYGTVYWSTWTGPHMVYGAILDKYKTVDMVARGLPVSDTYIMPGRPDSLETDLVDGRLYWSAATGATGAHLVYGEILSKWLATGGPAWFGLPLSDEEDAGYPGTTLPGARQTRFQYATVFWGPVTHAKIIFNGAGGMLEKYLAPESAGGGGGPAGSYGLPTSDRYYAGGTVYANNLQHGYIRWNYGTGVTTISH